MPCLVRSLMDVTPSALEKRIIINWQSSTKVQLRGNKDAKDYYYRAQDGTSTKYPAFSLFPCSYEKACDENR